MIEKIKNLVIEVREDHSVYGSSEFAVIKLASQGYCSACGRNFLDAELCFYSGIDNTIICQDKKCTEPHEELELRLFLLNR